MRPTPRIERAKTHPPPAGTGHSTRGGVQTDCVGTPSNVPDHASPAYDSEGPAPSMTRVYGPVGLIFAAALFATLAGSYQIARTHADYVASEFARRATTRVRMLDSSVDTAIGSLHATLALFHSSREVEEDEFRRFVTPLLARTPAIRAIEWAPRISSERGDTFPIHYLVPLETNEAAAGFNLASEPVRARALSAARDSGQVTTTSPIRLIQGGARRDGYLIALPNYGGEVATPSDRQKQLLGFVVGVFSLDDLTESLLSSDDLLDFRMEVSDDGETVAAAQLSPEIKDARSIPAFRRQIHFGSRTLLATIHPTAAFEARHASAASIVALIGGTLLSIFSSLYVFMTRREAYERARTAHILQESERRSRILIENAPDAILVYDVDAEHFVDVNTNAIALTGRTREELLQITPMHLSPEFQPDGKESRLRALEVAARALAGESPVVDWLMLRADGAEISCEMRLVRLPAGPRRLIRASLVDTSERVKAEHRQLRLVRELDHRVKNMLANVLAIAERTSGSVNSLTEFTQVFGGRLRAMARTHEAIAKRQWKEIPLAELSQTVLDSYSGLDANRIRHSDVPLAISSEAANPLALVLHELATNTCKHGALTCAKGRVDLTWKPPKNGVFVIEWHEHGSIQYPANRPEGRGLKLVRGLVEHELGGTVDIVGTEDGLVCRLMLSSTYLMSDSRTRNATPAPA